MSSPNNLRRLPTLVLVLAAVLAVPANYAQDGQTVDIAQMLQALRQLREETAAKAKADKLRAIQEVAAAASSGESAVAAWEKAEMAVHFDGVNKEVTAFKAWRDGEGEALKEAEAKNAARLYFQWLALTLQRSAGTPVKEMIPSVVNYTKELAQDQAMMDKLEDSIKQDKEKADGKRGKDRKSSDADVKKMHDSILNKPLGGSIVVQWLKLGEWVTVEKWEQTPGNYDGIFEKIILPELRIQRDQRVLEYWDMRIKREGDNAAKSKLEFERDKFNTGRLPLLLWRRATDLALLGFKNRAATDMFNLVRKYPTHPEAGEWMARLEEMLLPPLPTPVVAPTAPAVPVAPAPVAPSAAVVPPPVR